MGQYNKSWRGDRFNRHKPPAEIIRKTGFVHRSDTEGRCDECARRIKVDEPFIYYNYWDGIRYCFKCRKVRT